tara:strand:- start:185 stop:778 length:594 start_codon:yes stop_codon:yes gene_type:complete
MNRTGYRFPIDLIESVSEEYIYPSLIDCSGIDQKKIDSNCGGDFYLKYPLLFSFDKNFKRRKMTFVKDGINDLTLYFKKKSSDNLDNFLIVNPRMLCIVPKVHEKNILTYFIKDTRSRPEKSMSIEEDWDKLTLIKNISDYEVLEDFDLNKIGISGFFFYHLVKLAYFDNSVQGVDELEQIEISPYHSLVIYRPHWK